MRKEIINTKRITSLFIKGLYREESIKDFFYLQYKELKKEAEEKGIYGILKVSMSIKEE